MLYFSRAKTFGILLLCGLGILLSLPNLSARPSFWPGFLPWNQVHMGLDLRGGSYLLLQIDTSAIVKQDLNALVDETRQTLRNAQLGYTGLHADLASNQVVLHPLEGQSQQDMTALQKLISYAPGSSSPSVALSTLPDGAIAIAIPPATQAARNSQAVDQAITIIQRRIDGSGVLNPSIQRQGADQIVVQLPGISDPDRVKTLIGTTAHMTFQMVDATAAPGPVAPLGDEQLPMAGNPQQMMDVYANVAVDGASLENAQASTDPQSGQWVVNFSLNALGARQFADVTTANVGKLFAIVLDGKIIEAPVIREPITGGSGQISGNFTPQSATDLALLLRAGALPAPLNIVEEQSVGPELGADAIRAGALALGGGLRPGAGLHGHVLRAVRLVRECRAGDEPVPDARHPLGDGRHADPARHGRHPAHPRHGGGRQRADQRARARGGEERPQAACRTGSRVQARLRHHHRQ